MASLDPYGLQYALPLHTHAEGPTDPTKSNLEAPFVVLIAGAGKGIGEGIALAYAAAGASGIILASRTADDLNAVASRIRKLSPETKIVCQICDVANEEHVAAMLEVVKTEFDRLDVLVCNAAVTANLLVGEDGTKSWPRGIAEGSTDDFLRVFDVNMKGVYLLSYFFLPLLECTEDGPQSLIVVSSAASHMAASDLVPVCYSLSKFTSNRLVESIHEAHHDSGVCAYAVNPGSAVTPGSSMVTDAGKTRAAARGVSKKDDVGLCGGFLVWLTKEKRPWLSGRFLHAKWDVDSLEQRKNDILEHDKLKFRMIV